MLIAGLKVHSPLNFRAALAAAAFLPANDASAKFEGATWAILRVPSLSDGAKVNCASRSLRFAAFRSSAAAASRYSFAARVPSFSLSSRCERAFACVEINQ